MPALPSCWPALGADPCGHGSLRLGFIANFLSHPVISGFITASGLIIATSQVGGLLGIKTEGHALPDLIGSILANIGGVNLDTLAVAPWPWRCCSGSGSISRTGSSASACPRASPPSSCAPVGLGGLPHHGLVGRVRSRRQGRGAGGAGASGPAAPRAALVQPGTRPAARCPRAHHFHRGFRRIHLGRPDARRQAARAHCAQSGAHRPGRLQHRGGAGGGYPSPAALPARSSISMPALRRPLRGPSPPSALPGRRSS